MRSDGHLSNRERASKTNILTTFLLAAQLLVLGLTVAFPEIAHMALPTEPGATAPAHPLSHQDIDNVLENLPGPGEK